MERALSVRLIVAALMLAVGWRADAVRPADQPLGINSARITIHGTSNVHAYSAATTTVRVTRAELQNVPAGPEFWDSALKPGVVSAFEIAIPAATLASEKGDLDKNMHKALKTQEHANIAFRLVRFEAATDTRAAARAIGVLRIAGVEREVAFDVTTERKGATLAVRGQLDLLMTDYGITPPKAMLGMLKTDPKVTVSFEAVFAITLT